MTRFSTIFAALPLAMLSTCGGGSSALGQDLGVPLEGINATAPSLARSVTGDIQIDHAGGWEWFYEGKYEKHYPSFASQALKRSRRTDSQGRAHVTPSTYLPLSSDKNAQTLKCTEDFVVVANVRESAGTSAEDFAVIAHFEKRTTATLPEVKTFTGATTAATHTLQGRVANSARILVDGDALDTGSPEANITQSAGVLSITANRASNVFTAFYRRTVTVAEAVDDTGTTNNLKRLTSGDPVAATTRGLVVTSVFDTTNTWAIETRNKTGASGRIVIDGKGDTISNQVEAVPTASEPFLTVLLTCSNPTNPMLT